MSEEKAQLERERRDTAKEKAAVEYDVETLTDGQNAALGGASIGSNTGRVQVWARGTGRGFL